MNTVKTSKNAALTLAMLFLLATMMGGLRASAGSTPTTTFSGRAFVLSIQTPITSLTLADTHQLPPTGGEIDATPISVQTQYANAEVLLSETQGFDSQAESQAAVADLVLLPGTPNQITADFVMSKSLATCTGVSGSSDIANLQLAGNKITVSGQPNQTFNVPGVLTLVINEQTTTSNSITVNALDLKTVDGIEVIVSSAHSDISCAAPPQPVPKDFATGGGWIPIGNGKGTFGFVAGYKDHQTSPSGNLVYIDHTIGMKVKATSVTSYTGSGNTRTFGGDASINGASGYTYSVTVVDNGEPGAGHDTFSIHLSTGYSASGTLGGGNIEIHS